MKFFAYMLLLAGVSLASASGLAQSAPATDTATPQQIAAMKAKLADWPQLEHYRTANAALAPVAAG